MRNPAKNDCHPTESQLNKAVELDYGREVNIPGPVAFALWPGQEAEVREGHRLRSNQYLLVRVVNTDTAKANLEAQVATTEAGEDAKITDFRLATGALNIIKGTEVSFYIPPTGIEVVPDSGATSDVPGGACAPQAASVPVCVMDLPLCRCSESAHNSRLYTPSDIDLHGTSA